MPIDKLDVPPGGWRKGDDGNWYVCPPGSSTVRTLAEFNVDDHGDGTITVKRKIMVDGYQGYLIRGQWRTR